MTYKLHLRRDARDDVERAAGWYEDEAPEQVPRFFAELDSAVARVVAHPLVARVVHASAHRMHLRVFPYELWYLVHEDLKLVSNSLGG